MRSQKQMQLIMVRVRGPKLPNSAGKVGGVTYIRERAEQNGVYINLLLPRRRIGLSYPDVDSEQMKITVLRLPLGKTVAVEFCGPQIDEFCAGVATAGDNHAQAVLALSGLLKFVQDEFKLV